MKLRLRYFLKRTLLIIFIAAILVAIVFLWRYAPTSATVIAALIGALAVAFRDTLTNLIAGLSFLWARTFRVGDVIRLNPDTTNSLPEPYGVVTDLTVLHVRVRARDGMQILVPNSQLASTTVWIWYGDRMLALSLKVHLSYGSNFERARELILEACGLSFRVLKEPCPRVRLAGVTNGKIIADLRFWIADPQNGISNVYSDIMERLIQTMQENAIEIQETSY